MKKFALLILLAVSFITIADDNISMIEKLSEYFHTDGKQYESFFYAIQDAIQSENKKALAKLNLYPIRVNFNEGTVYYNDENDFIENYDKIVIEDMKARVKAQKFSELFYNYAGLHIGYGDIWFSEICGDSENSDCKSIGLFIYAYNVNHVKE
ncbi:MAG: hypothetical protein HKP09_07575 [Enterobacterales bacterium]|nr:hypothetical protein [Enterobacterales bacterium]